MDLSHDSRASEHESIEARAAAWVAEVDDGLTPEQEKDFAAWKAEDAKHEAAVIRLQSAWQALGQLREFRPEARQHPDPDLLAPTPEKNVVSFPWKPVLATAAAALIAITSFLYWGQFSTTITQPEIRQTRMAQMYYETTAGGYERATLPDGSVVELNEASAFELVFSPDERRVKLLRGEVHFAVAKNKDRPFVVEANGLDVRAVGTAFNVKLDQDGVEVLVTEGTVRLRETAETIAEADSWPAMVAGDWASVAPLNELSVPEVKRLSAENMRELLAWQGNRLVFVATPLAEAIEQFNGRNQVQIQINDPELAAVLIEGSFQAENIEAFVRLISRDGGIQVVRPSSDVIILQQAR